MAERPTLDLGVLEMLPVGILIVDRNWTITLWNRSLADWTGVDGTKAIGKSLREALPRMAERRYLARLESVMSGGPPAVFSYQLHADLFPVANERGLRRLRYCTASALPDSTGILFTIEDRTEVAALVREARAEVARRRKVEEDLRAALAAKEMLVRDVSHRVKNNLAMIVSLIALEAGRAEGEAARGFLNDLEARIGSIGLIHELLYKGDLEKGVKLDEYLLALCDKVLGIFTTPGLVARLSTSLEPVLFDSDATPYVGMMAAELITNSLKYGRVSGRDLEIHVGLRRDAERQILELIVEDNGPGFPDGRVSRASSLGWGLLELFIANLGGEAKVLPGPGARVALRIPERKKSEE